jgi:glycosyltransferase involved in cell wall biosynthesis
VYRKRYPEPISLTIVGGAENDAYDRRLRQRIANRGLSGVVNMVGAAYPSEVARHLEGAAVYVTTSLLESFGLTTLEAMASGVPVVASDATSFPEVCGDAALYCDPLDPEDIARTVHRAATDSELRKQLRERGHARVEQFGWERCASDYLSTLEEAALGAASTAP